MNQQEVIDNFEKFFNELLTCLKDKQSEYTNTSTSGFSNFELGANIEGKDPRIILHGYLLKHLVSYFDYIHNLEKGTVVLKPHQLTEKLGDIIVYMGLLKVMNDYYESRPTTTEELPF